MTNDIKQHTAMLYIKVYGKDWIIRLGTVNSNCQWNIQLNFDWRIIYFTGDRRVDGRVSVLCLPSPGRVRLRQRSEPRQEQAQVPDATAH